MSDHADHRPPPPSFRVRPAGKMPDREEQDGSAWRVHVFHIVTDDGAVLTEETPDGARPVVLTSLPMLVKLPKVVKPTVNIFGPSGEVIH